MISGLRSVDKIYNILKNNTLHTFFKTSKMSLVTICLSNNSKVSFKMLMHCNLTERLLVSKVKVWILASMTQQLATVIPREDFFLDILDGQLLHQWSLTCRTNTTMTYALVQSRDLDLRNRNGQRLQEERQESSRNKALAALRHHRAVTKHTFLTRTSLYWMTFK